MAGESLNKEDMQLNNEGITFAEAVNTLPFIAQLQILTMQMRLTSGSLRA